MGKRKTTIRSSDDDGATVYPIFVDTNLDTHLALIVSYKDTVADLRRKIKLEHPRCFPVVGKVKIKALQVKRRGHLYHLSDSMLVKSAFGGAKKNWFVYVDASSSEEQILNQHIGKPNSSNQLALPWVTDCPSNSRNDVLVNKPYKSVLAADHSSQGNSYVEIPKYIGMEDRYRTDNHWKTVDSDSNKKSGLEVQSCEGIVSKKRLRDMQRESPMEGDSESVPAPTKKRKIKRNEFNGNTFEKGEVLICGTTDVTPKADETNQEIFCLDQEKSRNATSDGLVAEAMDDEHISTISVREKKKKNKKRKDNIISVKPLNQLVTVVPEVQEVEEKRTFKENMENIHNHREELVREVVKEIKAPFSTTNLSKDDEDEKEVFPTPLIRELHDLEKNGYQSAQNNIGFDDQIFEGDQVDKCEQNKDVLLSHDPEVKLTERGECVYQGDKDASYKEQDLTSKLSDPKGGMESENVVVGKNKKRKNKKSSTRNEEESVLKDVNEGVNVSISGPSPDFDGHLKEETRKEGSILSDNEGKERSEEKAADAENNIGVDDQTFEGDQVDKCEQNKDVLLSLDPEVKLTERGERIYGRDKDVSYKEQDLTSKLSDPKGGMESENVVVGKKKKRKNKKSSTRNEEESVLKDVNEGVNVSISGPSPDFDGHLTDETRKEGIILSDNEGKERSGEKAADAEKVISNEPDFSPMTTDKNQRNAEHLNEKSRKKSDSLRGSKRRKDGAKIGAARNENEPVVKHDNDDPGATEKEDKIRPHTDDCKGISEKKSIESHMTAGGEGDNLLESGAEILQPTETNRGKLDQDVILASKECENANGPNRKKKKVKKSTAKEEDASVMKLNTDAVIESTSAVPNPTSDGLSMEKLQKDECVSLMEETGLPEEKAVDAPQGVPDKGSDDAIGKEAETLQSSEINRGQEKDKSRRRRKKSQNFSATSFQGFPTQEQEGEVDNSHLNQVDRNQENAPRSDKGKGEVPREFTVADKSLTSGLEQASGLELEAGKSNGIEQVSSLSQNIPMDVCLSEVPPSLVIETIVEADTGFHVDASNGEGEGIDFKQYFVPGKNHNEGAPNNKVKEAKKSEKLMKSRKNKEKVDVPSSQSQKPLSVVKNNEIVSSSKKSPEVSVAETKAPNSHPVDQFKTPKKARQSNVVNWSAHAVKRNNGSLVGSSSNSDSSVRSRREIVNKKSDLSLNQSDMAIGKTAAKKTGEVVNNSQRVKSLLATPGTIFGDDSSNSSADDNGTVDSDASTRTPSDKSLSSESEGESDSSVDSRRNGSSAAKGKGRRRSYLVDSQSSDMKDKSIGEILRSSSRFKKAKLTASQYQEDTEDIDFVPESQPIS